MTELRGGPLDGVDVDMPWSVNGLVDVPFVDGDGGYGIAEYRIDGRFKTVREIRHCDDDGCWVEDGSLYGWAGDDDRWDTAVSVAVVALCSIGLWWLLFQLARWAVRIGAGG